MTLRWPLALLVLVVAGLGLWAASDAPGRGFASVVLVAGLLVGVVVVSLRTPTRSLPVTKGWRRRRRG